ncbi:MAG: peptidoglycan DD-metalloendopeptidase family protein [Agromyces sp.]
MRLVAMLLTATTLTSSAHGGTNIDASAAVAVSHPTHSSVAAAHAATASPRYAHVRRTPSESAQLPLTPVRVTRGFDPPRQRWNAGHRGIDLRSHPGQAVRSPVSGTIRFNGVLAGRGVLSIQRADGLVIAMEPVSSTRVIGERVWAGDPLGQVALGGHCQSHCLHVGVFDSAGYRSPLSLFQLPRVRLLPDG